MTAASLAPTYSTRTAGMRSGLTERQLNYAVTCGHYTPELPQPRGSGSRWRWTDGDIEALSLVAKLHETGLFTVEGAFLIVRSGVLADIEAMLLAAGDGSDGEVAFRKLAAWVAAGVIVEALPWNA